MQNPFLGVVFHWLGGLASGSFYVPYKGVRKWSWETYWLVGGFFTWIICPWFLATLLTQDVVSVLAAQSFSHTFLDGLLRCALGLGRPYFRADDALPRHVLGMGVALGYCAAFGTLSRQCSTVHAIDTVREHRQIASTNSGKVTLAGVAICLLGIGIAALAGLNKEREMPEEAKKKTIAEFNFNKGLLVATFSGIMSACFAFALTAGNPIAEASAKAGTSALWMACPSSSSSSRAASPPISSGASCLTSRMAQVISISRRKRGRSTLSREGRVAGTWCRARNGRKDAVGGGYLRIPVLGNYLFSALAGTTWYFQFFFYTMGATQMGKYDFASWTLHMASIIIFSTMWGWIFHEWKGSSKRTHTLIALGIATLICSTIIVGYGNHLKADNDKEQALHSH